MTEYEKSSKGLRLLLQADYAASNPERFSNAANDSAMGMRCALCLSRCDMLFCVCLFRGCRLPTLRVEKRLWTI